MLRMEDNIKDVCCTIILAVQRNHFYNIAMTHTHMYVYLPHGECQQGQNQQPQQDCQDDDPEWNSERHVRSPP